MLLILLNGQKTELFKISPISSFRLHTHLLLLISVINTLTITAVKLTNLIASTILVAAFAFAPFITKAQDNKVDKRQDRKEIHHDQRKLARNRAQRNRAVATGHHRVAAHDQRKVNRDRRDLHHDRKDLRHDKKS